jgi:glyoxylase-like metal-dependent hydrolase (beta-lactamase superfamily II)
MQWKIGDVTVTQVRESLTALAPQGLIPDAEPAVLEANASWLRPHFVDDDGNLTLSIHALVVQSQGRTIVVDTCVGDRPVPGFDAMSFRGTGFLDAFGAEGFTVEGVDTVLCTHLHFDHVGWNTRLVDGRWVPTFPNARYLFARLDYEYWDGGAEGSAITFDDAVRPVMAAGLADLVETDHRITDEVWLEPTPGHTPGHVSVRISSQGHDAVITGDLVHHPVQFVAPQWTMVADDDAARASATRVEFRTRYADTATRIFGTHFGGPSCGHLRRDGEGWRFEV